MIEHRSHTNARRLSKTNVILLIFIVIAAFFLWTEHRAHLLGALPYLLLLGCVFMHFFMHRDPLSYLWMDLSQISMPAYCFP